ncbi:MAG: FUN14 domain-containing protein [Candidatus Nitrosopolaris sp.]
MIDQTQNLISAGTPLVAGGLVGFATGFAIRKIMKLVFIGLGLLMLVLGFLEYKHWISVNWTLAENQSNVIMTHVANRIAAVTQHVNHEIPIGMGLLGFAPGLLVGFYKG